MSKPNQDLWRRIEEEAAQSGSLPAGVTARQVMDDWFILGVNLGDCNPVERAELLDFLERF